MIKLILSCRLFVAALCMVVSVDAISQTVVLKFNPEKGKEYDCLFEMDIKQQISGQNVDMTMDIGISMTLIGQEGNIRLLEAKYNYFGMSMDMPGNSMKLSTKDPAPTVEEVKSDDSKMMHFIFSKIVNQKFLIKINDTGDVVAVTGFAAILDSLANSTARELSLPDEAKESIRAGMANEFNDASMKKTMQESFGIYPKSPIKVGDSWVKHVVSDGSTSKDMTTTYTVASIEGSQVKLKAKSRIKSITISESLQRNFSGVQTADIILDLKSGMVMNSNFDQDMKDEPNKHYLTTKGKLTATVK